MKFKLSRHARQEMGRRRIPAAVVKAVLDRPEQVVEAPGGFRAYQSKFAFGRGKMYLVRAIVAEEAEPPVVVTVYRTSKVEKYWRQP
jgi:hypothetical protein